MKIVKSDIEIARASNMKPIGDVLGKFNIPDDFLSTYGVIDGALGVYFPIGKKPYINKREVRESFSSLRSAPPDISLNESVAFIISNKPVLPRYPD